jgi:hypothetical protein
MKHLCCHNPTLYEMALSLFFMQFYCVILILAYILALARVFRRRAKIKATLLDLF